MNHYEKYIEIRWADCDANRHVRHSAYYDFGAHVRIRFFADIGMNDKVLNRLRIGPIIFKEECSFIKELHADDTIRINCLKEKISEDGGRWILHHEIFNGKDEKVAHITLKGAWMDLDKRKLAIPPKVMATALHGLPSGESYTYRKGG